LVDEGTIFRWKSGAEASFGDVTIGRWVVVAVAVRSDASAEAIHARAVVILSDDSNLEQRTGHRVLGKVTEVNAEAGTFGLALEEGETVIVKTSAETRFRGVSSLADLKPGMWAGVIGVRQSQGSILARLVVARTASGTAQRYLGRVAKVDTDAGLLTLTTRDGEEITVALTAQTRFRGQVSSAAELQPGMWVGVMVIPSNEGTPPVARVVLARAPKGMAGTRYVGQVAAVAPDAGTLTVETRAGDTVTLSIDERTRFRGAVHSLADLEPGQRIAVVADEREGALVARLVVAHR
jgi:hypothetical protein